MKGPSCRMACPQNEMLRGGGAHADALTGEEPLPLAIQQAYQGHRHLKGFAGQPRQAFKTLIVTGIKRAGSASVLHCPEYRVPACDHLRCSTS